MITTEQIKALREKTGAGVMECKRALVEAGGKMEEAERILKAKGSLLAAEKAYREARQGVIASYVHGGKIGVLVEVSCETDFVARTDELQTFAHELCLQIASMSPRYIRREDVPSEEISQVLADLHEEIQGVEDEGAQPIQQSHMENFYRQHVLLDQLYIKDPSKTVQDLLHEVVSSVRENIVIRRFVRFSLGENQQPRPS